METDGNKLKEYALRNSIFWAWPPNEDHYVTFLGFEEIRFEFKGGISVPTIRYYFQLANGTKKPRDIRSIVFAERMAQFKSGDYLKLRRNKVGDKKYEYAVSRA